MLERLKYINHLNEVLSFGDWAGLFVNSNELHDFSWDVISVNNRISGFDKSIQEKSIPVRIACTSMKEGMALRNKLFEIPEKDVLANQYGKLWINGYYCKCYIKSSTKSYYSDDGKFYACDLVMVTDYPFWVKETSSFFQGGGEISTDTGLDYNYDFPHDYTGESFTNNVLSNDAFYDCKFKMIINGSVNDPYILINDHMYQVTCNVDSGEYLTIDSVEKTIYLTKADGSVVNEFNERNRDYYIFRDIPAGNNTVTWSNLFDFTIMLLEERSEPRWDIPYVTDEWQYEIDHGYLYEYSPINTPSGYVFSIEDGNLIMTQNDNAFDGVSFSLENGNMVVTYE